MTKEQLISQLTESGAVLIPLSEIVKMWPRYTDDDFVETEFVGPRPSRPPHTSPPKIPGLLNETE